MPTLRELCHECQVSGLDNCAFTIYKGRIEGIVDGVEADLPSVPIGPEVRAGLVAKLRADILRDLQDLHVEAKRRGCPYDGDE